MTADVAREEFSHVVARVEVVEREIDGEKLVTRYILEQTRRNGDDLAAIKTRLDRVESRLDRVESQLDGVESRLDRLERKVDMLEASIRDLVRTLPGIVSGAVRQALSDRGET